MEATYDNHAAKQPDSGLLDGLRGALARLQPSQLTVAAYRPFDRVARRVLTAVADAVPAVVRLDHIVRMFVVPARTVSDGRGGCGFAAFRVIRSQPEIWIAGQRCDRRVSDAVHARTLIESLAHELAHYEQWRDGKVLRERGVNVRARTISRRLSAAAAPSPGGRGHAH